MGSRGICFSIMLLADKILYRTAKKRSLVNKLINNEGIRLTITVQVLRSRLCWMRHYIFHYAPLDARSNNRSTKRTCSTRCTHAKAPAADNFRWVCAICRKRRNLLSIAQVTGNGFFEWITRKSTSQYCTCAGKKHKIVVITLEISGTLEI